ncbi:high affinity immunoglobulin epsilon receptor subunit alpha isoform X2 [Sarcophilus harrisii]|nr:high affinity immunoglobulin epsilon receptor subunit alpha isoform X2 [Sarcophilus harrisii]
MEGFSFTPKLLWVILLFGALTGRSVDAVPRSIVSLHPSWRVSTGENVTFHCEIPGISGGNQTKWLFNGTNIPYQTSSFSITATIEDSGKYRCKIDNSSFSDPVYLGVYVASSKKPIVDTSKAILSLTPPWNRIFRGDNVSLHCKGYGTSNTNETQWFHNGNRLSEKTPTYDIIFATYNDSGEYECQTGDSAFSDSTFLGVYSDWLLLQASLLVIEEGEPLILSCHGWKNRNVYKVTFYHNNRSLNYWYENHNFYIPYATINNRGFYHCSGILWRIFYTSELLYIDFKGTLSYMQILIPLMTGILFGVDTAILVLTRKQLHYLLEKERILATKRSPKADPEAESKVQVEVL